jgi:hypothetical protein
MKQCDEPQSIIQGKDRFGKWKEITRISKALTFGEIIVFKSQDHNPINTGAVSIHQLC